MGLSETILAAMIGAIATVSTALFQLFTVLRGRYNKVDSRPKKGTTLRSIVAVLALMVASAVGGFLYSEFQKQRSGEDMRAMRDELKELRSLIADGKEKARAAAVADHSDVADAAVVPVTMKVGEDAAESVVYVPACRRSDIAAACNEGDAQRIALCGTIPSYARVDGIELFVQPDAVQHPWDQHRASFEQDLDGARFTGKSFEYAQGTDLKAVCVNFMHWSSEHPHIARVVVRYGFGSAPARDVIHDVTHDDGPSVETLMQTPDQLPGSQSAQPPTQTPAVIAADNLQPLPNATSLATTVRSP